MPPPACVCHWETASGVVLTNTVKYNKCKVEKLPDSVGKAETANAQSVLWLVHQRGRIYYGEQRAIRGTNRGSTVQIGRVRFRAHINDMYVHIHDTPQPLSGNSAGEGPARGDFGEFPTPSASRGVHFHLCEHRTSAIWICARNRLGSGLPSRSGVTAVRSAQRSHAQCVRALGEPVRA